jgi:hypothetical protein
MFDGVRVTLPAPPPTCPTAQASLILQISQRVAYTHASSPTASNFLLAGLQVLKAAKMDCRKKLVNKQSKESNFGVAVTGRSRDHFQARPYRVGTVN